MNHDAIRSVFIMETATIKTKRDDYELYVRILLLDITTRPFELFNLESELFAIFLKRYCIDRDLFVCCFCTHETIENSRRKVQLKFSIVS